MRKLKIENSIKTYIKEEKRLQKGKYKIRNKIYVFECLLCKKEIHLRKSDITKVSGRCRSCVDKESGKISSIKNRKLPYEALYNKFIYDRKRFNQMCNISFEDFIEFTKIKNCHYCNKIVNWSTHALYKNGAKYNLDRKDNNMGYIKDNCTVCCWECNEIKGNRFSYNEFIILSETIKEIYKKRDLNV